MVKCVSCDKCCCVGECKYPNNCLHEKRTPARAIYLRFINTNYMWERKDPVCKRCRERGVYSIPNSVDMIDGYRRISNCNIL